MLEERLNEWMQKVLDAYNNSDTFVYIDTYKMVVDVDKIIAEAFGHYPIFTANM